MPNRDGDRNVREIYLLENTEELLSELRTASYPPPGSLLNGTEEGLYFQSQSL